MNNKLFARIAVAVICICMMSTVAFAADPTFTPGDETATLSFNVGTDDADITVSSEDQITLMAYLVDGTVETVANIPDYTNQTVVALNQVDGAEGFGEVLIAASKLEEGKKIAVVLGGSDGTTEKFLVAQEVIGNKVTVTFMNGATATPVVAADGTVTLPAAPTLDAVAGYAVKAFTFIGWVDETGNTLYTENLTNVTEDMVLYAKYDTGLVYGDVTGDGVIKPADRLGINAFLKDGTIRNFTNTKVNPVVDVVAGDVTGDNVIKPADRLGINAFLKDGTLRNKTNTKIYYVNKVVEE